MATARAECFIPAPRQQVFGCITDHGRYDQLESVTASRLLKEGDIDKNGLGAVRELKVSSVRFVEVISHFEAPTQFEYRVLECYLCFGFQNREFRFPLVHHKGQILLQDHKGGTNVFWLSKYTVALPFGGLIANLMQPFVARAFKKILLDCKLTLVN